MSIQETAYAKYQLDWMVQNNISLSDLMNGEELSVSRPGRFQYDLYPRHRNL